MLRAANAEVSLRSAGVAARNTQLTVQLEGQGARLASAEQAIQEREGALAVGGRRAGRARSRARG